jgi:hypothetical protein
VPPAILDHLRSTDGMTGVSIEASASYMSCWNTCNRCPDTFHCYIPLEELGMKMSSNCFYACRVCGAYAFTCKDKLFSVNISTVLQPVERQERCISLMVNHYLNQQLSQVSCTTKYSNVLICQRYHPLVQANETNVLINSKRCGTGLFQCKDKMCILDIQTSDGHFDCFDNSDELKYLSPNVNTSVFAMTMFQTSNLQYLLNEQSWLKALSFIQIFHTVYDV